MSAWIDIYNFATQIKPGELPTSAAGTNAIKAILEVIFGMIGALSLLIVVVSGLRYILSAGSPEKVSKAKNGIIYALVGLAIAISAEGILVYIVKGLK